MNDRLHKIIYGQTLDEMKEDKGAWEYEQEPSREAFNQVMWERDIAIEQLHELGYELGQKIEPSGDLISRQAVLDGVDRYIYKSQSTGTQDDFYSFAELVVKALPSVNPQEPKWIPVSERLPEEDGAYLVTVRNLTGYRKINRNVFECEYFGSWAFQGWEDNEIIAWMPLPEPYEPQEERDKE